MHNAPAHASRHASLKRRLLVLVLALLALLALAAAWSWSPLRSWLDVDRIVAALQQLGQSFGPVAAVFGFALACAVAVPMTFLTLVTLVAFGPATGFCVSLAGAVVGAAVSYGLGVLLGREVVLGLAGPRLKTLSERLGQRGLVAVIAVRMVPIAPFAVVNMVAGATHIRLRDMLLGTAIGMTPGTLAMMFFVDQIVQAIKSPGPVTLLILALGVALIGAGLWGLRRWVRKVEKDAATPGPID
jgi:uncharacterized membrane protein YdjX (TVP38/TMEM64 family)